MKYNLDIILVRRITINFSRGKNYPDPGNETLNFCIQGNRSITTPFRFKNEAFDNPTSVIQQPQRHLRRSELLTVILYLVFHNLIYELINSN